MSGSKGKLVQEKHWKHGSEHISVDVPAGGRKYVVKLRFDYSNPKTVRDFSLVAHYSGPKMDLHMTHQEHPKSSKGLDYFPIKRNKAHSLFEVDEVIVPRPRKTRYGPGERPSSPDPNQNTNPGKTDSGTITPGTGKVDPRPSINTPTPAPTSTEDCLAKMTAAEKAAAEARRLAAISQEKSEAEERLRKALA